MHLSKCIAYSHRTSTTFYDSGRSGVQIGEIAGYEVGQLAYMLLVERLALGADRVARVGVALLPRRSNTPIYIYIYIQIYTQAVDNTVQYMYEYERHTEEIKSNTSTRAAP